MINAQELKKGQVIRHEGLLYKIVAADYHISGGKGGGVVNVKMRDLKGGHLAEHRFDSHDKIEDLETHKQDVEYSYSTKDECFFMNQTNFEQVSIAKTSLGPALNYLKEGMKVQMEFFEGNPLSVIVPPNAEVTVAATAAGIKGETGDSTYKAATLDNGLEVLVPQFIKTGDLIKVEVETGRYIERLQKK